MLRGDIGHSLQARRVCVGGGDCITVWCALVGVRTPG